MSDGVLRYRWADEITPRLLLVVPASLREELLGPAMTLRWQAIRVLTGPSLSCWSSLSGLACGMIARCTSSPPQHVAGRRNPNIMPKASLGRFHAGAPAERVHLDILGPFNKSSVGNVYILMLVCQFFKWIKAYPIPDQTTEQIASTIVKNFISRFGCPVQIHTDQGRNFDSDVFQAVYRLLEITKSKQPRGTRKGILMHRYCNSHTKLETSC